MLHFSFVTAPPPPEREREKQKEREIETERDRKIDKIWEKGDKREGLEKGRERKIERDRNKETIVLLKTLSVWISPAFYPCYSCGFPVSPVYILSTLVHIICLLYYHHDMHLSLYATVVPSTPLSPPVCPSHFLYIPL